MVLESSICNSGSMRERVGNSILDDVDLLVEHLDFRTKIIDVVLRCHIGNVILGGKASSLLRHCRSDELFEVGE